MRDRATSGGMRKPERLKRLRDCEKLPDAKVTGSTKEKTVGLRRAQEHLIKSLVVTRTGHRSTGRKLTVLLMAALARISDAEQKRKRQ